MKVDLVMWARNGAWYLPKVLGRIEKVIPGECINKKILIDDSSVDNTPEIAKSFEWSVYPNALRTPSGATNEALRRVTTPLFVSIEQDLFLAEDWWDKIPSYMEDRGVAVAQGIRISHHPIADILGLEIRQDSIPPNFKWSRIPDRFMSFDNNIFRTSIIREVGGFPMIDSPFVDWAFGRVLEARTNYRWVVDPTVVSLHLRSGIRDYFRHEHRWIETFPLPTSWDELSFKRALGMTAASSVRGLQVAFGKRYPQAAFIVPYRRLTNLHAYILRRKKRLKGPPV